MPRKTQAERDRINVHLRLKQTTSRPKKVEIINEWVQAHGTVPEWLLHDFGHTEFVRGYTAGTRDASA